MANDSRTPCCPPPPRVGRARQPKKTRCQPGTTQLRPLRPPEASPLGAQHTTRQLVNGMQPTVEPSGRTRCPAPLSLGEQSLARWAGQGPGRVESSLRHLNRLGDLGAPPWAPDRPCRRYIGGQTAQ